MDGAGNFLPDKHYLTGGKANPECIQRMIFFDELLFMVNIDK
jgi:hypothetical protein